MYSKHWLTVYRTLDSVLTNGVTTVKANSNGVNKRKSRLFRNLPYISFPSHWRGVTGIRRNTSVFRTFLILGVRSDHLKTQLVAYIYPFTPERVIGSATIWHRCSFRMHSLPIHGIHVWAVSCMRPDDNLTPYLAPRFQNTSMGNWCSCLKRPSDPDVTGKAPELRPPSPHPENGEKLFL